MSAATNSFVRPSTRSRGPAGGNRLSIRLSPAAVRRRRLSSPHGSTFPWLLALKASGLSVSALAGVYLVALPLVTGLIPIVY